MTNNIRKRLGPASVVMTIAVLGVLAAFIALAAVPGSASAQNPPPPPPPVTPAPEPMQQLAMPANAMADASVSRRVTVTWDAVANAGGYEITWSPPNANGASGAALGAGVTSYIITSLEPATSYTITIMATHASNASLNSAAATVTAMTAPVSYTLSLSQTVVKVANQEVTVQASVGTDSSQNTTVNVRIGKANGTMYWLDPEVSYETRWGISYETGGLKAPAGTLTRDDGSFDVRSRDQAHRVFEIFVECEAPSGEDIRGVLDIEVRDEDQAIVAEGSIMCMPGEPPPPPPDEVTAANCYSITGYMDENRDDIKPLASPAHPTNAEIGQNTIQLLNGSEDVQLTVTSCEEGPVYIRFLDRSGNVFGTDVDECDDPCVDAAGADVVGLDSQGKLELNLMRSYTAAQALMYDQYDVITPGDGSDMWLRGKVGSYYQGKFRFYAPCAWGPFQVQVHEADGKVLQTLQNGMMSDTVSCIPPLVPDPTEFSYKLSTTGLVGADGILRGTAVVEWGEIPDAVMYWVGAFDITDANNPMPVGGTTGIRQVATTQFRQETFSGLITSRQYLFAVIGELADGSYSGLRSGTATAPVYAPSGQ